MAIYHCTCKIISRGKGRSAVGSAAYRSGEKLKNEYDGIEHDYTKKGGVVDIARLCYVKTHRKNIRIGLHFGTQLKE